MVVILLLTIHVFGQQKTVYKYKSSTFKEIWLDNSQNVVNASNYVDTSLIIVIDLDKKKITLYGSKKTEEFNITKDGITSTDDNEFDYIKWEYCIGSKGQPINIRLGVPPKGKQGFLYEHSYLYLDFSNIVFQFFLEQA